jgi:putative transposase
MSVIRLMGLGVRLPGVGGSHWVRGDHAVVVVQGAPLPGEIISHCVLLRGLRSVPRVLVTDKLASYGVAHRRLMRGVEHRRSKYLNNRAENSHQPTRQRERAMKKFASPGGAQRFLFSFSGISFHFRPRRHRLTAAQYRHEMTTRFTTWNEVVGLPTAA